MKRKNFPGSGAIAPETMTAVWAAFDAAWSTIEKSGATFLDPDKARDILGKGIIDAVRSGEREPMKLTALGILALANSDLGKLARTRLPQQHNVALQGEKSVREFCSEREERVEACREEATNFMKLAEQAHTDELREAYLRIAIEWLKLAAQVEKLVS